MRLLQSLLLATDFQPASENAARVAAYLAGAFGARIGMIHVVDMSLPAAATLFRHQRQQQNSGDNDRVQSLLLIDRNHHADHDETLEENGRTLVHIPGTM